MSADFTTRETRGPDGWREIGVNNSTGELVAVVTRPMSGADWFVVWLGRHGKGRFKTRKAALAAAVQ
jgi:hypothetical protein